MSFPKGNAGSKPIRLDAAIFDDPAWLDHYNAFWRHRRSEDLEWLNEHLLAVVEFKKNDKDIEKVFTGQVKPAMKEKDPATAYVLGVYYAAERLYLFHRRDGFILRYDESLNQKGALSKAGDLSLHLPDAYRLLPSFDELKNRVHRPTAFDRSRRGIADLDIITSIASVQIKDAFSNVLRSMDQAGLVNQRGYNILVQTLALKIFDEKRNERTPQRYLEFYATEDEGRFQSLAEPGVQSLIARLQNLRAAAAAQYRKILRNPDVDWKNANHLRAVVAIVHAFQDYSFVRSTKTDLYQIVFYNFANTFKRDEAAQFLTPLPVIQFLVEFVNPRDGEKVFDPCCGIADFLSLSYVHASTKADGWRLDDANIYGVDLDENMIILATLNMLLNGDGEAKLFERADKGSILAKVGAGNPPALVDLLPDFNARGKWDERPDDASLLKFEVVLTNPPFGEDRAFRVRNKDDRKLIETYETWHLTRQRADAEGSFEATHTRGKANAKVKEAKGSDAIDLGVVFLENACRVLKEEGRLGIVLSNSIASINRWSRVREWIMQTMRLVAFFDLPANVFAETGVNTSLLVAYKPKPVELARLQAGGYRIFTRDIQRVGYEKRTAKRNVFFNKLYKVDEDTFETLVDAEGFPVVDEEFSETLTEFRQWALGQEATLQRLFLRED